MAEYKQAWIGLCLGKATKGYETTNLKNWQFVFTDVYWVREVPRTIT